MATHQIEHSGAALAAPATPAPAPAPRRRTRSVAVAAALVALMVTTGFAMLAIVPLGLVLRGVVRDRTLRELRPWAAGLAATYLTPLVLWAALPGRERSLSRDMHPAFVPVIAVAVLAVLVRLAVLRRRARTETTEEI